MCNAKSMVARLGQLKGMGVNVIVLLALTDEGRASYDPKRAGVVAGLGIPVFACTPDQCPDLMPCAVTTSVHGRLIRILQSSAIRLIKREFMSLGK